MPFKFSFDVDPEGMTVPYAPLVDEIRHNRGFVDLRKRPDRAKEIAEGANSPALRDLLMRAANADSHLFTIGCDLGAHLEPTNVPASRRDVAGGYIQFASNQYDKVATQSYAAFAGVFRKGLKARVGKDHWTLNCVSKWVDFNFDNEPHGVYPSCGDGFSLEQGGNSMRFPLASG